MLWLFGLLAFALPSAEFALTTCLGGFHFQALLTQVVFNCYKNPTSQEARDREAEDTRSKDLLS